MNRRFVSVVSGCLLGAALVSADDFCYPSMHPPGGQDPQSVPMFIVLGWDDNAYSGEDEAIYFSGGDWQNGGVEYKTSQYPQGLPSAKVKAKGGTTPIVGETGYGVKWVNYLNTKFNIKSSFYFTAGQGESKDGYNGLKFEHPDGQSGQVPVVWGREQGIINNSMKALKAAGHELGNHTLDHMEINVTSNKGLPEKYMKFGSENYFGTTGDHKGWMEKAGTKMSQMAWDSVLARAEKSLKLIDCNENIGFRAPRLEINSNGLNALKERGYLYDCSYEEGSQPNFTAARSLWPYTSCNGSPSNAFSGDWGKPGTNYPKGLWLMNTPHLEIPTTIIDGVITNWKSTKMGKDDPSYVESIKNDRKVIAYDFNTLVMMGMTKEHFVEMLKFNFDQRYNSNRAPLLLGLHCDYFSPMYDEETLLSDPLYDDVLKFNNHQDRKDAMEEFLEYVTKKQNVKVVTMQELVQWMQENSNETIPSEKDDKALGIGSWDTTYVKNATVDFNASADALEIEWKLGQCTNHTTWEDWPEANVGAYNFKAMEGVTHFEIEYASEKPFYFSIETGEGDDSRSFKTLIGHADYSKARLSGPIPVRDFEPDFYDETAWVDDWNKDFQGLELDAKKITGFAFGHGAKGCENKAITYKTKITKLIAYGAEFKTDTDAVLWGNSSAVSAIKVNSLTSQAVKLNVPSKGRYRVDVYGLNGKQVSQSYVNSQSAGQLHVPLQNKGLVQNLYVVKVVNMKTGKFIASEMRLK